MPNFPSRFISAALVLFAAALSAAGRGQLEIRVTDRDSGKPIAVRMQLKDQRGKPVKPPKVPWLNDHFVFEDKLVLDLPLGAYSFDMERGPEYRTRQGSFQLDKDAADNKVVDMPRFFDMKKEGWWSGDLHVQREAQHMDLLMRAEDLYVAPVVTWANEPLGGVKPPPADKALQTLESNRFVNLLTGRDRRESGQLLFFQLSRPLEIAGVKGEVPPAGDFLKAAAEQQGHVDIARPFSWDLPVWIAAGQVHSFEIFGDHLLRSGTAADPPGKPRDTIRFGGSQGLGRYSLDVYYHLLNCGLRLPPTAGSGSGLNSNPLGYNRVYVHCGDEMTYESWWKNLRAGRTVVTNGPLLQPRVNGELPGHVFHADAGQTLDLSVALNLGTREKIEYLEVVQDGKAVHEVRLDEWAKAHGELPPVHFDKSGWMLVRVVTNNTQTFRGAITAPFYVEIGYDRRISKTSAKFFLEWVVERAKRLKFENPEERESVLVYHRAARDYWQKMVDQANAD